MRDYIVRSFLGIYMVGNAVNLGLLGPVFLYLLSRPNMPERVLELAGGDSFGALIVFVFMSYIFCFLLSTVLMRLLTHARFRKVTTPIPELKEVEVWVVGKMRRTRLLPIAAHMVSVALLISNHSLFGIFVLTPLALVVENHMAARAMLSRV